MEPKKSTLGPKQFGRLNLQVLTYLWMSLTCLLWCVLDERLIKQAKKWVPLPPVKGCVQEFALGLQKNEEEKYFFF